MKTKVTIEDGITEVILIPENDFEKNVIETAKGSYDKDMFKVSFETKSTYGLQENHQVRIKLEIKT